MELEKLEITEQTVKVYSAKLNEYVINERPFDKGHLKKTHLLDMLYLLGTSIDEERFLGSNGFNDFKELIQEAMA